MKDPNIDPQDAAREWRIEQDMQHPTPRTKGITDYEVRQGLIIAHHTPPSRSIKRWNYRTRFATTSGLGRACSFVFNNLRVRITRREYTPGQVTWEVKSVERFTGVDVSIGTGNTLRKAFKEHKDNVHITYFVKETQEYPSLLNMLVAPPTAAALLRSCDLETLRDRAFAVMKDAGELSVGLQYGKNVVVARVTFPEVI